MSGFDPKRTFGVDGLRLPPLLLERLKETNLWKFWCVDLTAIEAYQPRDENRVIKHTHNGLKGGPDAREGIDRRDVAIPE